MSKVTLSLMVAFLMAATSMAADISDVMPATAQTIEVGMVRWLEDGSFEKTAVNMSKKKFEEYIEKIKSCQTPEEGVAVLQEYDIVPEGKTLDDLRIALEAEILEVLPEGTTLDDLRRAIRPEIYGVDTCGGAFCLVVGHIEGEGFFTLHMPVVFYLWSSSYGGSVTMMCLATECSCEGIYFNDGTIIGFVGAFVPKLWQFWMPWDTSYGGFALLIRVFCY